MTSILLIALLIPLTFEAIKILIYVYSHSKPPTYLRNRKGQFMNSKVKMWKVDYKNSYYGRELVYKLSK